MQNAPQFLISFFAILRVRAVVVPINPMSTTEDLSFYVNDCEINHALIGQELYDKVAPLQKDASLESVIVAAYSTYVDKKKAIGDLPEEATAAEVAIPDTVQWKEALAAGQQASLYNGHADDEAVIPYTSGTTGLPKGCVHTNRTVQANTVGAYHWNNITPDAVTLVTLPLFHVTGLLHSMLTPVLAGGMMVLFTRWDRDHAGKAIETYRCSHWVNISTMLIDLLAKPNLANYDVSSLHIIGGGSAPLPEAVGQELYEWTGHRYVEGYGLSEAISHTHVNPPDRLKLQRLGVTAFDVDADVIEASTGKELGIDGEGELIVNGPQVFKGYYNREEENKASHILIDGKQFFRTGDIVKM